MNSFNLRPSDSVLRYSVCFLLLFLMIPFSSAAEILFEENFESGAIDWGIDNGVWEVGEATSGPGSCYGGGGQCAGTVLDGNYPGWQYSRMVSPELTLPELSADEELVLRFREYLNYNWADRGEVQIQVYENDAWSNWTPLKIVAGYIYTPDWHHARVELTAYAGQRVRLGFYHVDGDESGSAFEQSPGWYIDDVEIIRQVVPQLTGLQDFEAGWGQWYSDRGIWEVGEATSGPGSCYGGSGQCAGTVLDGNYPGWQYSRLVSPELTLPVLSADEELVLRFREYWNYQSADKGKVQISMSLNGVWSEWVSLKNSLGSSASWQSTLVSLTAYSGQHVRLGFYHEDGDEPGSAFYQAAGWYIDDVEVFPFFNNAPVLTSISNQTVTEGDHLIVGVSASDPNGQAVMLTGSSIPSFGSLTDNGDGTGTFQFDPVAGDAGIYQITVTANDGSLSAYESFYLIVNPPPDTLGPELSEIKFDGQQLPTDAIVIVHQAGTFSCTANDPSGISRVEFYIDSTLLATARSSNDLYSVYWDAAQFGDGLHTISAVGYDTFGNQATVTGTVQLILDPPPAPIITEPTDGLQTNSTDVQVVGEAQQGSQVLLYRNGEQIGDALSLNIENRFSGSLPLVDGNNIIQAAARNRAGVGAQSSAVTVTLDSEIPSSPTGVSATSLPEGEIRLIWNSVDESAVVGYDLYRAASSFNDLTQASKINTEPLAGTSFDDLPDNDGRYYYRVVTVSSNGKSSDPSTEVNAQSDRTPPSAVTVEYLPEGAFDTSSGRISTGNVAVNVTVNEPLSGSPFFSITPMSAEPLIVALTKIANLQYSGNFEITPDMPAGVATATFSAHDAAGNIGSVIDAGEPIVIDNAGPVATITISPNDPIENNGVDVVEVAVTVELNESLAAGQVPVLSYLLSGAGRVQTPIEPLLETADRIWEGSFELPLDAGSIEVESFSFVFNAIDDLGNTGSMIYGNNFYQVYRGDLPPLDAPTGLVAEALPGGEVRLRWMPVAGAVDYQLFRQGPGETDLSLYQRTGDVDTIIDLTSIDGLYRYAISSIRQANTQEAVSAFGEVVEVDADSVPPSNPSGLTVELVSSGVIASWLAPPENEALNYRLYRSNIEIVSTAGMTPVVTDIHELSTVDPSPSNTEHFYAVTAVDAVGNESSPSDSVYLGFDLLPVSSLTVEQLNQDYPVVNWTHNGDNVIGYNLYIGEGAGRVLVPGSPMAGLAYTDIGYDNSERRYTVAAVDTFGNVSIERSVTLSPLETRVINPPAIKRGLFTAMEFEVSNLSSVPVGGAVLQLQLGTSVYQTESFNLAPEESHTESLVVAGYLDLPSIAPLTTSVSVIQPGGETTRTVRTGNIEVIDGALVAGLLTNNFTRGVSGTVRFTLENTGDQEIGIVTARNFGAIGSDEVKLRLEDTDGNLLATQTVKQVFGENLITLSNGTTLARIAPGAIFTSKPVQIPVPLASPDEVFVKLVVDKVHHAFATPNAIQLPGPTTRQMVRLVDVAYGCSVTGIAPLYSQGGEPIVLTGSTVSTADGSPLPLVPLRLVIRANGFERKYDLYADTAGNYSYTFNPLPWESGIYSVSCIHPDLNDRHESGQFTIGKVFVLPNRVQLFIERNTEEIIPLQIHSAAGTTEKSISLAFDASDQPDGELPPGIQLVLSDPLTLPSGGTGQMSVRVQAGSAAEAGGTFVVAVRDDTSGGQKLAFITVDFNVYEPGTARPSLVTSKSYIETGVTYGNRVSETLFIENRGLTEARDIQIALTNPDGSPAPNWIYLASPASIDKLDVGESQLLEIVAAPTSSVAEALHEFRLRFSAANHKTFQQSIFVTVTTSEIGDVQLHVSDIYTQTKNDADELIEGVENAKIRIQNQNVLTIDRTLTTDVWGNAVSTNLPAGLYKYRATAADHQDRIGFFWIRPGISVSQEVFLDYNLVTVEWSVREITIQDRYEIVLKAIYKVDIPAPVVVTEPPGVTLPPMEPGDVYHGQFDLVNYGLIRADNLAMQLPASNNYFAIDFLSNIPGSLGPKQRITIPYRVTGLAALASQSSGASSAAASGSCELVKMCTLVGYQYVCANGTVSHAGVHHCVYSTVGDCPPGDPPQNPEPPSCPSCTFTTGGSPGNGGSPGYGGTGPTGPPYRPPSPPISEIVCPDDCSSNDCCANPGSGNSGGQ